MSFSFDLPENPSTSAEFLTASESAINFTEDSKLKTDHIRNSNVLSKDASLTETTHSNHAPSSDKSACVSPSVYENSNESRRTSEVESNQDVTSPGYSEVGSVASPRFDFDQPLKNDYYDYLAPSANRANEVYGGYRLNLSSSPIGHNESSPMGNVPSDTEAGFIDEDSVLEYYPHAYRDRDDGPYYDLRTVLDNNSYDYLSDFTHYEDNYRAQQEFYDERATDSDNTLSTDESSFSSRQRFMLPLDTIEEIEESPRATEEFGHDNQSLDDYLTPGERDTGEYGEPHEEQTHESVTSSSRTSSSSVESSRTSCEDEFKPALHSPSYNAQQELLAVNTTSAHNLSANLCDTEDSSVTRFHSCVSRELDDLEDTENNVSSENRNTLDNAKPMPVNSTSEKVKKLNGNVNNSDYRLSQELSLTLSDDEEEEGTALRIPDSVMNSKLARFGGSLSDISSSGFPFGVGRGGGAGAAGGGGGSGGGSRRPSASNPNAAAATESLIQNLTLDDRMIELTKQKLYYHFQNPCWKFRVKGTKPIKMMVQVIKIIFVTLQLSLFSKYQFDFRLFIDGNFQTFDHLFLLNWEADYGDPVQRVPDPYAVYHIDDFYASVNFTVTSYFTLTYKALGNFSYPVNYNGESHNGKKKHRGGSALGPAANLPNDEIPPIIFKLTFYEVEADPDQPYHMKLEGDPVSKYYYVYYGDTDNGEFDMVTWEGQKDNDFSLNWSR